MLNYDDLCKLSRKFNETANLGDSQDCRINEWLKDRIASENAARSEKREWPHDRPAGWNLDVLAFLKVVVEHPSMWLFCSRAKYLELRIDTRDGAFNVRDRDSKHMNPDEVVAAAKVSVEKFGAQAHEPYRAANGHG